MTSRQYVNHLVRDHGVPRPVAVEAERRCREALGKPADVREREAQEIARMCALAAREARVS